MDQGKNFDIPDYVARIGGDKLLDYDGPEGLTDDPDKIACEVFRAMSQALSRPKEHGRVGSQN